MSNNNMISENTTVRVGLVLGFLITFGGAVWWASKVNTKLDDILAYQATAAVQYATLSKEESDLAVKTEALAVRVTACEVSINKIQTEGSTSADKRLTVLEREIDTLVKH